MKNASRAATRRLLEEQVVFVAVLGSGKKSDAMWYVPQVGHNHVTVINTTRLALGSESGLQTCDCDEDCETGTWLRDWAAIM